MNGYLTTFSAYEPSVKSKASRESSLKASLEESHEDYKDGEYSSDEDHQLRGGLWSSY